MSPVPAVRQPSDHHHHRKELIERQLSKERNLSAERAHAIERSQDRYVGVSGNCSGSVGMVGSGSNAGGGAANGQPVYKDRAEMVEVRRLPEEETYLR